VFAWCFLLKPTINTFYFSDNQFQPSKNRAKKPVEESALPGLSISYVARKHGLSPSLLYRWRQLMSEGGKVAVQADDQVVSASENRALKKRVRELERLLGRKTMEVEILKEGIKIARERKLISRTLLPFEEDSL